MKKTRFFVSEKNAYHTIPIYGNCMNRFFLIATQKFFQVIVKLPLKISNFFNRNMSFVGKQVFSEKKLGCKI